MIQEKVTIVLLFLFQTSCKKVEKRTYNPKYIIIFALAFSGASISKSNANQAVSHANN